VARKPQCFEFGGGYAAARFVNKILIVEIAWFFILAAFPELKVTWFRDAGRRRLCLGGDSVP
jgi:hypothetical protein